MNLRAVETEAVTFASAGISLAGTFTRPTGEGPHPIALILAGSGPLDRNGDLAKKMPLGISRLLADHLIEVGWGTLRFDKRGVGRSQGEYLPTGFFDELADAEAALNWLRARSDVSSIVVIGHSAGAVQATEMAARHPDLAGAVLLSASLKTGKDTMRWQNEQLQDVLLPTPVRLVMKAFGTSLVKQSAKAIAKLEASTDDVVRMQLVAKVNAKWMREFIAHDPCDALRSAQVPLLAITGAKDVQVDPDDLSLLDQLAPIETKAVVIPDVDHILRHEDASTSNPRKYRQRAAQPLDPRVVAEVQNWLTGQ